MNTLRSGRLIEQRNGRTVDSQELSKVYQPALRPEQVKALYYLKLKLGRPMTELVRDAVEVYLDDFGGVHRLIPPGEQIDRDHRRNY